MKRLNILKCVSVECYKNNDLFYLSVLYIVTFQLLDSQLSFEVALVPNVI